MAVELHWQPDAILALTARDLRAWHRKITAYVKARDKAVKAAHRER